ncbi:hypothetical protein BDN72DRAFT_849045 [Pluteus cervinus]|uniref:Uncharacterized protein n=1 Tax=Pluteus cervinus TaxID=181527 RepID=A0ACD3A934_9AGAR|nr:hypothetical protein BDN72DRAFT_849045 [Pluteus cervinus]
MTSTPSVAPPTTHLPPIRSINSQSHERLSDSVVYLRRIYSPEVRGSRRRGARRNQNIIGGSTSTSSAVQNDRPYYDADVLKESSIDSQSLNSLRSDDFERSYAIRWLTALIAHLSSIEDPNSDDGDETTRVPNSCAGDSQADTLLENASALLAVCSGAAGAGILTRDIILPTMVNHGPSNPIVVHLRDIPLDNADYGSLGAQTWGGACVLAELIAEDPEKFRLDLSQPSKSLRILELGAGTGLVSLAVAKVIERLSHGTTLAEVVATDYYPSVIDNMTANIHVNFPSQSPYVVISGHPLDWSTFPHLEKRDPPLHEPFDIVFGADIIYETLHATWIRDCLKILLRKPSNTTSPSTHPPTFHLVIPLRSTHTSESSTIETVFPSSRLNDNLIPNSVPLESELVIYSRETIVCDTESGGGRDGGEVTYAYYQIGWGGG